MIAIVYSIYSQSIHAPALDAGLMDNDAERYCIYYKDLHVSMTMHRLFCIVEKWCYCRDLTFDL